MTSAPGQERVAPERTGAGIAAGGQRRTAMADGGPAAGRPPRAVAALAMGRQPVPGRGRDGDRPQRGGPGDGPAGELALAEGRFYREDAAAAAVSEALDQLLGAGPDPRWDHLTRALGLSAPDASLLALALAAEAAPELRRVYSYLRDDTSAG